MKTKKIIHPELKNKSSHENPRVVCLGGGIGTVQLLRGMRHHSDRITVIASMADDGGSGGRLRRLFSVPPPGDLINCIAALSDADPVRKQLLTYRFEGNRWGRDDSLGGQKLGNLILVALTKIYGDFNRALVEAERIFSCHGRILPASRENVSIWALTRDGKKIVGEETIDRGKYNGKRQLDKIHLEPENATASHGVKRALQEADIIIAGPGDLYTTILPVLLVKDIARGIKRAKGVKVFVINIANKPFETPWYTVSDYVTAITKHLGFFPFEYVLYNTNSKPRIPKDLHYQYVIIDVTKRSDGITFFGRDLVNTDFPLYHGHKKLARAILRLL